MLKFEKVKEETTYLLRGRSLDLDLRAKSEYIQIEQHIESSEQLFWIRDRVPHGSGGQTP